MTALIEKIASQGGATRQQLREATAKAKAGPPKHYVFAYRPPTKLFNLKLSFAKARVQRDEIIDALEAILRELRKQSSRRRTIARRQWSGAGAELASVAKAGVASARNLIAGLSERACAPTATVSSLESEGRKLLVNITCIIRRHALERPWIVKRLGTAIRGLTPSSDALRTSASGTGDARLGVPPDDARLRCPPGRGRSRRTTTRCSRLGAEVAERDRAPRESTRRPAWPRECACRVQTSCRRRRTQQRDRSSAAGLAGPRREPPLGLEERQRERVALAPSSVGARAATRPAGRSSGSRSKPNRQRSATRRRPVGLVHGAGSVPDLELAGAEPFEVARLLAVDRRRQAARSARSAAGARRAARDVA